MAARPPAWEAETESIKPLGKQCSVCTVVKACGPRSAGSRHTASLNPSSSRALFTPFPARWRRRAAARARDGTTRSGLHPRALPCALPLPRRDWGPVLLLKQGLRRENGEEGSVASVPSTQRGKVACEVGRGQGRKKAAGRLGRALLQYSKQKLLFHLCVCFHSSNSYLEVGQF